MRSIDTPEVRARLAELTAAAGGRLTPERVVEDARNESSPLHRLFDWSDAEAAAKWRLEQARMVLRAVRYEYVVQSVSRACVAYVRDPEADAGEQGYVAVSAMRSDQARASVVLAQELMRVRSLGARGRALGSGEHTSQLQSQSK